MSYKYALAPWNHQTEAGRLAWRRAYFAWLMEMGTGKTKVCIDEFMQYYLEGLIDTVVIFAPKGVYRNWVRTELPTHIHDDYKDEVFVVPWEAGGGNASSQAALNRLLLPGPGLRVLVINTESMSSGETAYHYALRFIASSTVGCYMAVDESTFIKSPTAARSKKLWTLGHFTEVKFRRIMTGSPVTRSPLDLYGQAEFLQESLLGQSFFAFRARYAVLKEKQFPGQKRKTVVVVGYKNTDALADKLKEWSYRVTKDECLDLPPKIYTTREVELTPEQFTAYREMRDYALTELSGGGMVTVDSVITRILRLQQLLCGHVRDDDGNMRTLSNYRLETLMDVLSEVSGKAIIWNRFRHNVTEIVDAIRKEYGPRAVAEFHGGNTNTRQADAERFVGDPECRFMVATYAGGYGNTWVVANTVIYYSNDLALEKRLQSEDRAHRGGQTKKVTYVDLVVKGSVDESIIKALRANIDMASAITGDNYKEWVI